MWGLYQQSVIPQMGAQVNVLIYEQGNPYDYVEVRGKAKGTTDGADEHIDRLVDQTQVSAMRK